MVPCSSSLPPFFWVQNNYWHGCRIRCAKGFEEALLQFAINIWNQIGSSMVFNVNQTNERGVLEAMKLAVASYSEEKQNIIVEKSYNILLSTISSPSRSCSSKKVIIAVYPQTCIPNARVVVSLFMTTLLNGNVVAAQVLGTMVNKLDLKSTGGQTSSDCTLEEAIYIILKSSLWIFQKNSSSNIQAKIIDVHETGLNNLCNGVGSCTSLQIHAIVGLAWIGKGLLMRGHEKVKYMAMIFLRCLQSSGRADISNQEKDVSENNYELDLHYSVMNSAADAFQILMGESEQCLNQEAASDSGHTIVNCLIDLIQYPHKMVLRAVIKALDDPKRAVRREAVRCRQAWASIA
ncbi:MMS19 nucleotide excision repair protein, putative isoform 3 [Hibiscus syriacus]|uniref:MMS19 nucleotide excision repair protein n=1 Tax=Hibiscus syriacus TaxID=106335 RepID=A0A6A3AWR9_HIBSY|nr:MMS19 nucleotide excision repair protein, putative isoform 3 [Hibiscus syriacus]